MPLDIILMTLDNEKYIIDWIEFINISLDSGWKIKGTISKLEDSFLDVYDPEFSKQIINKIKELYL